MRTLLLTLLFTTGLAHALPNSSLGSVVQPVDVKQLAQNLPESTPPKWLEIQASLDSDR